MSNSPLSNLDNTKGILLTDRSIEAIRLIKIKLRKTAETIIEIGELLVEAIDTESTEYKNKFYDELGMSPRSGQRYMQIAKSEVIQKLKEGGSESLANLTMTDLLNKMNANKKPDTTDNSGKPAIEASKRAENIFKQYKENPAILEEIITNLQELLKNHNKEGDTIEATITKTENR